MIPRGDRSGVVVEPMLTDQWYVNAKTLAKPAIEVVEQGRVKFVPESWSKTYFEWMRNIQDWCISRQLWWGHRIPAWYDEAGNIYVARDEAEARRKHGLAASVKLRQDDDVLDTWFSSALWPFATMGWPDETPALRTFYPTNVLVTSFDIIFFWVARMIMMGLEFMGDVPFREVYIHALVRDHEGQKMSKSKGNILDPLDLIDGVDLDTLLKKRTDGLMQTHLQASIEKATRKEFPNGIEGVGTDALRFTFASLATTGRDARFDLGRAQGYHRFCNKLWNASAYVLSQIDGAGDGESELGLADRWIRSRLAHTIREVHSGFAEYRLDLVAQTLYDFAWHELCDWYLELTKAVLTDTSADPRLRRGAQRTLADVLGALLKLLHPLIPFVTEELWLELCARTGAKSPTVMLERMPEVGDFASDAATDAEIEWLKAFVVGVRQIRGDSNLPRSIALAVQLADASETRSRARRASRRAAAQARRARAHRGARARFVGEGRGRRTARRNADPRAARGPDRRRVRARPARQAAREVARRRGEEPPQAREPELRRECAGRRGRQGARARRGGRAARGAARAAARPARRDRLVRTPRTHPRNYAHPPHETDERASSTRARARRWHA